jgi:hypothetical protein
MSALDGLHKSRQHPETPIHYRNHECDNNKIPKTGCAIDDS